MTTTNNEKRIEKVARRAAKLVIQLRADGQLTAAYKLEQAAIETCQKMREGRL